MKKNIVIIAACALLVSSCGTYTGSGAYTGSTLGSILGSAIGGISGGARGYDIGTIAGMVGGAVIGGAIGAAKDRQDAQDVHDHYQQVQQRKAQNANAGYDNRYGSVGGMNYDSNADSGFDATNSGDDRLYDFNGSDYTGDYTAQPGTTVMPSSSSVEPLAVGMEYLPALEVRNARIVDDNQDNAINRDEVCKVIFEVYNHSQQPVVDVVPTVVETTGNRHIYISPSMHVERIEPGQGIRYTAMLKADSRLKNGTARICVSVLQGNKAISKVCEFNVPTRR